MNVPFLELGDPSPARAWGAVCLSVLLVFFIARAARSGERKRGSLALRLALRLAGGILGAAILLNPTLVLKRPRSDGAVAVVLDASASMGATDADGRRTPRWRAAARAVKEKEGLLGRICAPVVLRFEDGWRREVDPDRAPRGSLSDFARLEELREVVPGVKGVVFLSDGRRGGGPDPREALARLGVPVHAVAVGNPSSLSDAAVESVRAAPFGFKNVEAEARVLLRFRAVPPGRGRLKILSRGETLGSRWIVWSGEDVIEATVTFRPSRTGTESFEARLDAAPGETNVRNNALSFVMDIGRNRRRVLYICGRPGPNYAFLRQQLKNDPTVELVSFVILRDAEDMLAVPDNELSLIPFPSEPQLLEGLPAFDAVIFEDFSFRRFGMGDEGMGALKRFVREGGGFLLMGEGNSFSPASPYRGTEMEPLIPFRLDLPAAAGSSRFRASPAAGASPFSPLEGGGSGAWASLAALAGDGRFPAAARPGAVVLLRAGEFPLAAVSSAGRGRVLALASLDTWRWALGSGGSTAGPEAYVRFWSGALAWLTGGEEFRRVRLLLPREGAAPAEEFFLRASVRDEAQRPVAGADVRYSLREADGSLREGTLSSLGAGEYGASFTPRAAGLARVEIRAHRAGSPLGQDRGILSVGAGWEESRDTTPDFAALEELARGTGGLFTTLPGFTEGWLKRALAPLAWETTARVPLGRSLPLMGLWTLVLLAEWTIRRRRGFP